MGEEQQYACNSSRRFLGSEWYQVEAGKMVAFVKTVGGGLVVAEERRWIGIVEELIRQKKPGAVTAALARERLPLKGGCHTVTFDTGKEFAGHASIVAALQADIYFVDPWHA